VNNITSRFLALAAIALLFASGSAAHAANPESEIEKLVGKPISESFKAEYGVVKDPTVTDWVNRVGHDVASQSPRQDINYTFVVGDTDLINAFSVPGGTIFVTRGLLDNLDGDEELAGVLAHEVGHEYHYHAAKLLAAETALSVFESAVLRPSTDADQSALLLANVLALLSFSRHNESEADQSGVDFSSKASYDPRGLSEFFAQINETGKDRPRGIAELFETHPSTPDRIRRVGARIDEELTDADWQRIGDRLRNEDLYGKAAGVYDRGYDTADRDAAIALARALPAPPPSPVNPPVLLPDQYGVFNDKIDYSRKVLDRAFGTDRINSALQQLLALSVTNRDVGMVVLAAEAYALDAQAQSVAAAEATITRTSPSVWLALDAPGSQPAGSDAAVSAAIATGELSKAADAVKEAVGPLRTAEEALTAATLDLDASAFNIGFKAARTAHYAALQAALVLADLDVQKADRAAAKAHKLLDAARLRLLEYQLNTYPASAAYTAIAARRLDVSPDDLQRTLSGGASGYGTAAILLAYRAELVTPPADADSLMEPGKTVVDVAIESGASLNCLEITTRMVALDFMSARTVSGIGAVP